MIKIRSRQGKNDFWVEIDGHANYAPRGHDIVCSAISVLFQTLVLYANEHGLPHRYEEVDKSIKVLYIHDIDEASLGVLAFFMLGVKGVEQAYPMNVTYINETPKTKHLSR